MNYDHLQSSLNLSLSYPSGNDTIETDIRGYFREYSCLMLVAVNSVTDLRVKQHLFQPIYNSLVKSGIFSCYMYPWTGEEVKEMNLHIYSLWRYYANLPVDGDYHKGGMITNNRYYLVGE